MIDQEKVGDGSRTGLEGSRSVGLDEEQGQRRDSTECSIERESMILPLVTGSIQWVSIK